MMVKDVYILAIESSCDDTSAAVSRNDRILANVIAGQEVHRKYGGVVPELASRAHQQHIIPVVQEALHLAKVNKAQLSAVAFTQGPGLIGSLMVGASFAKAFALASGIPVIAVNHMEAHVLANFSSEETDHDFTPPSFPFLCLTVSGGHTQIVLADDPYTLSIKGQTLDDAAGEAFDKSAKILGLPYPGGPLIDKLSAGGDKNAFAFPIPSVGGLDFSFSGLKTAFLYFIRENVAADAAFVEKNLADICASLQHTIIKILLDKLIKAIEHFGIRNVAIAGGVSANSELRKAVKALEASHGCRVHIPAFQFCTDNAGMIATAAYFKFLKNQFATQDTMPMARMQFSSSNS
jgi:N6-L-threonylcarbamoyladenine synthase